jgi:hypothetical protein
MSLAAGGARRAGWPGLAWLGPDRRVRVRGGHGSHADRPAGPTRPPAHLARPSRLAPRRGRSDTSARTKGGGGRLVQSMSSWWHFWWRVRTIKYTNQTFSFPHFYFRARPTGRLLHGPLGSKFLKLLQDRTHWCPHSLRWVSANSSRDQRIPQSKKKKEILPEGGTNN